MKRIASLVALIALVAPAAFSGDGKAGPNTTSNRYSSRTATAVSSGASPALEKSPNASLTTVSVAVPSQATPDAVRTQPRRLRPDDICTVINPIGCLDSALSFFFPQRWEP